MAAIEKRILTNGEITYRIQIRKKNSPEIHRTFYTEEDAKLFVFYKERLINNMKAFDINIKETVTIDSIFETKYISFKDKREIADVKLSCIRIKESLERLGKNIIFINDINYDLWIEIAKDLLQLDVYKGAKTESGKRKMSIKTLKKIFSHVSSAISFAQKNGIELENYPLMVNRCFIKGLI